MTEQLDQRAAPRHQQRMLIYKIFRGPEWQALQSDGSTLGAPVDREDGYIHLSTAEQAPETAAKYFAGIEGLWLIAVETDGLDNLRWEPSRGGALFPPPPPPPPPHEASSNKPRTPKKAFFDRTM